jgi:hypothetical protein
VIIWLIFVGLVVLSVGAWAGAGPALLTAGTVRSGAPPDAAGVDLHNPAAYRWLEHRRCGDAAFPQLVGRAQRGDTCLPAGTELPGPGVMAATSRSAGADGPCLGAHVLTGSSRSPPGAKDSFKSLPGIRAGGAERAG